MVETTASKPKERKKKHAGLTLVELMVVVVIIAITAMIAVPALTRDSSESHFKAFVRELAQDMQRARFEAISTREDRAMIFTTSPQNQYTINGVIPGETTMGLLKTRTSPPQVEIYAVYDSAAEPASGYPAPSSAQGLPAEVRFTGINVVHTVVGGSISSGSALGTDGQSATVFVRSTDDKHKARIVIYKMTGYSRVYYRW